MTCRAKKNVKKVSRGDKWTAWIVLIALTALITFSILV